MFPTAPEQSPYAEHDQNEAQKTDRPEAVEQFEVEGMRAEVAPVEGEF